MSDYSKDELNKRMQGAIAMLRKELSGLRTGRASVNLLDVIQVEAYGSKMPLNQCASISVPEPRMLAVQVWDKGLVNPVEKAIHDANLGLNPNTEGQLIRLIVPELNEERRKELVKIAHKYTEQARVAVRHVRKDGMDILKRLEKDGNLSEDDARREQDNLQKLVDDNIKSVDDILKTKEEEIMQV